MSHSLAPSPAAKPHAGAPKLHRFASQFLDDHTEHLAWPLNYDQLDRGCFEGTMLELRLPGLQLFRETTSRALRQRGGVQSGAIGIARMCHGEGSLHYQGREASNQLVICGLDQELDMRTPPDCTLAGMVVDTQLLSLSMPLNDTAAPLEQPWVASSFVAESASHATLIDFVTHSLALLGQRPQLLDDERTMNTLRDHALLHIIDTLSQVEESGGPVAAATRQRVVAHACELMLSRPDEPPSLLDICRQVAVSPRKLGYCFQEVLGQSPQAFLRVLRLNAARRELARLDREGTSVYDVAARWGFWHFGRFSTDYKLHFGESPSQTLKRGRARHASTAA